MIDIRNDTLSVVKATILVVAALFPIVNPLGSAAIFTNMVGRADPQVHRILVQKVAIYSFFLLIGSLLFGTKILSFFGISIYAVQIGGGLVVAATGWALLSQSGELYKSAPATDDDFLANAFYPYTLPITVGPGSISVAVALGAHLAAEMRAPSIFSPKVLIASFAGTLSIALIIYVCYRYAKSAERLLGSSGTSIVMRLCSFILFCIGIQIVSVGIEAYLATLKK